MKTIRSVCTWLGILLTLTLVLSVMALPLHWRSLSRAKTKLPEPAAAPAVSAIPQGERVSVRLLRIEGTGDQSGPPGRCNETFPPVNTTQAQVSIPLPFQCADFMDRFSGQIQLQVPSTITGTLDSVGRLTPDSAVAPNLNVSGAFSADPIFSRGARLQADINGDFSREVCFQSQEKIVSPGGSASLSLPLTECTLRLIPPRGSNFVVTFFVAFGLWNPEFNNRQGVSKFSFEAIYERVGCPANVLQGASQGCPVDLNKSTFTTGDLEEKKVGTLDSAFFRIKAVDSQGQPALNRSAQIEIVRRCLTQPEQRRIVDLPKTDAQGESRIDAVRELAPGEYEYIAKIDGAPLTNAQASYKFIWLGGPDSARSRISLQPLEVWANNDDQLSVEVKVCDACGRYPQKRNEGGLPVGLKFTGPESREEPAKDTDQNGIVKFDAITFDKPGDYTIESLVLADPLNKTTLRVKRAPRVDNFDIIQAITLPVQDQKNYLVENKPTVIRVYVRNRDSKSADVGVSLRIRRGAALIRELQPVGGLNPRSLQPGVFPNRMNLSESYNFVIPPDLAKGTISVEIAQNPKQHRDDQDPDQQLTFNRKTLSVRYVLFEVGGLKADPARAANSANLLQQLWPISRLDYAPLINQGILRASNGDEAQRTLTAMWNTIQSDPGRPDFIFGWLPSGCGGSGNWNPKALKLTGNPANDIYEILGLHAPSAYGGLGSNCAQKVFLHELAHDYFLAHPGIDAQRLIGAEAPPAHIEDLGVTPDGMRLRLSDWEMMNQGHNDNDVWISQFSWKHLFNRLPGGRSGLNELHTTIGAAQPLLLVRGSIPRNGPASLDPIYPALSNPVPSPDGPYCLRLEDAAGQLLFNRCFIVADVDNDLVPLDTAYFTETLPRPAGLAKVVLTREARVLAERRASANAPTLTITAPTAGETWDTTKSLQWTAQDSDGDPLRYNVQYSPNDRQSWIPIAFDLEASRFALDPDAVPGGDRSWFRVIATDGVNAATAEAGPIRFPKKGPQVFIIAPRQDTTFNPNLPVTLQGAGFDFEDGGLPEENLTWSSDRDGNLGSGSILQVTGLSLGTHRIILSGRDRDGNTSTTSVIVQSSLSVPIMAVLPANLHFGHVMIGQSLDAPFTISNTGNATLTVNSITGDNPQFSVTSPGTPFTVAAGATTTVTVRFTPGSESAQTGTLSFISNDPNRPNIDVTLEGIGAARIGKLASVSAASYGNLNLAPEAISAAFGLGLATATNVASTIPLPTSLSGTTVKVRDNAGNERLSPLFYVSPGQINYLIPPGTTTGAATITVTSGDGALSVGAVTIAAVAPGFFTANQNGQGVPAALVLRAKADGTQLFESVVRFDVTRNQFVAEPIDLGPDLGDAGDQLFLILFGTGWRFRSALSAATCNIGGVNAEVLFAGAQSEFTGLDQMNVRLARNLAGRGEMDVVVTVDGKSANTVRISVK